MRLTVRCPADGVVEVSLRDLDTVVVRSGSDVEATYSCPLCGSPITVAADLAPAFVAWASSRGSRWGSGSGWEDASLPDRAGSCRDEAYLEYFRRELAAVRTVEDVLALIDVGPRR
jgi:hypothetical protein